MNDSPLAKRFIARFLLGCMALHLAFCLFLILFPDRSLFGNRALTSVYKIYLMPGPFFKDELIKITPHLLISYKPKAAAWTPWTNPERNNFLAYQKNPWLYYKLKQSTFERHLARSLARKIVEAGADDFLQYGQFNELHRYLAGRYLPSDTDSVSQVYLISQYDPGTRMIRTDTLYHLTYKSF